MEIDFKVPLGMEKNKDQENSLEKMVKIFLETGWKINYRVAD